MKKIYFILLALTLTTNAFANGFTPVPGSCTQFGMGKNLCSCDLKSTTGGDDASTVHSDTVACGLLQCSDFVDAQGCGGMKQATCELSNPRYSGECEVVVNYPSSNGNGQLEACTEVQRELNSPFSFGHDYCMSTSIRGEWTLDSSN